MLKDFYIGDTVEYVSVEYAKSNRSSCKNCKQKIGNNQLRVGLLVDDDHFSTGQGTAWFHKGCFQYKPRHKVLEVQGLIKKIHGLKELANNDQKDILNYLKKNLVSLKQGKSKKKLQQKSQSQPKKAEKSKGKQEEKSKPQKLQKTKPKKEETTKHQQDQKNKPKKEDKIEQKPVRRGRSLMKKEEVKQEKTVPKTGKSKPKPQKSIEIDKKLVEVKKKRKEAPAKFLTPAQINKYKELRNDFADNNLNQLKEILQKNGQPKTGVKADLIERCADGKQFGRIPTCTKCGGGKLRFNRDKGSYNCPGYMEDTDFVHCGSQFTFDEIKRQEWIQ